MGELQEIIKLISSVSGFVCIVAGIIALFKGIKAEGEVDIISLIRGKIRTGSAGIMLLFFGLCLIVMPILKGKEKFQSLEIQKREEIGKYIQEIRISRSREFL